MTTLRLTLVQRIAMTIALLVGVFLLVGGFTAWAVHGIQTQVYQTVDADLVQLERMAAIQQHLLQVRRAEKDISIDLLMKMERVPQRIAEWKKHAAEARELLKAAIAAEVDPALQQMLAEGQTSQDAYMNQVGGTIQKIERQEVLDQAVYEMEIEKPVLSALAAEVKISQAIERNRLQTKQGGEQVNAAVSQLTWTVALGMLFAVISGVVLGSMLLARIRKPLAQLTGGISRVKSGDLSRAVAVESQDELGRMSFDFNQMTDSLTAMVTEVRLAADSITGASSQIASGNLDLSNRTEHAAASLQHAAASLDALSVTVGKTAEASHAANDIAKSAATAAGEGRDLVLQVVSRMEGIQASSNRITDITSVIDGIAFQTNILALNAAVEAARAGEQGRGFAVVAGEVRSLAQRSAEAAREIKSLIENSRDEVATGSRVAHDAGAAMSRIVSQVAEVRDMIQTITRDANSQSGEISDVNKAMTELEQMTQQNAALVEQAAAASASLQEQADKMVGVMGVFTVRGAQRQALLLT